MMQSFVRSFVGECIHGFVHNIVVLAKKKKLFKNVMQYENLTTLLIKMYCIEASMALNN